MHDNDINYSTISDLNESFTIDIFVAITKLFVLSFFNNKQIY